MSFPLPIDAVLPRLIAELGRSPCAVLTAPPGAGKTTRVPPALLDSGLLGSGQIVVLQPRRVAARATARRMAEERRSPLGEEIGYQIRFERKTSTRTRIIVVTEGVLIRRLLDDPFLEGVAAVVLDEFHERHLDTDLALAMVHRVQSTVRPDLKLIVMSATLAAAPLVEYLGGCPLVDCPVRGFPISVEYANFADQRLIPDQVASAVERVWPETSGDLLAFLPGVREIQQTQTHLGARLSDAVVLPLYGELSVEEQDRVFEATSRRKVILSTNIAETSLTIPGVTVVVDSGWARTLEFEAALGLNRLVLKPISKASADQRAGRAGRTGPGRCVRLWTEASHRARADHDIAEILRVDLSGTLLELAAWGEQDLAAFPWFETPPPKSVKQAERLLGMLEAIAPADQGWKITPLGQQLATLPIAPRLGRLVIAGREAGHGGAAALLAALFAERDPFQRTDRPRRAAHSSESDALDRLDAVTEYLRTGRTEYASGTIHPGAVRFLEQAARQLERACDDPPRRGNTAAEARGVVLRKSLLAAFPDRLARRREPNSRRAVMVGGRGVRLAETSAVDRSELFVCIDVEASGEEALVRQASAVEREWLSGPLLTARTDVEFDAATERVQARRRTCWADLTLDESPTSLPESDAVAGVLAEAARSRWSRVYPPDDDDVPRFVARVQCLRQWMPDLELPAWEEAELQALLPQVCWGMRSLAELRKGPWLDVLKGALTARQLQAIEREAPDRLSVPSGSRLAISYTVGQPPVLAVRIQEIFGLKDTPRVAGGRVKVLLHLLAPNHRPQQITDDLRSFWTTAYPQIRSELRRKYPRHAWPDDPLTAMPERRPQRKREGS